MGDFLRTLAFLGGMVLVLALIAPDTTRQVFGMYDGLGILPIIMILVILAALSHRRGGRHPRK